MTKSKAKNTKKSKSIKPKIQEVATEMKLKKDDATRLTLMESIRFVRELRGGDIFKKLLPTLMKGKYIHIYAKFIEMYDKFDDHHNDVSRDDLDAVICLLIYIDCKALPMYGSLENKRLTIETKHLISPLSWRKDFKELLTLYTTYQQITVDTADLTYLF